MRSALFVILLTCVCTICFAQQSRDSSIHEVQVCDLLKNPQTFDGQLVRFRGRLIFEFEGNRVDDRECSPPLFQIRIRWVYGADNLWELRSESKQVQALVSPIEDDAALNTFRQHVHLRRRARLDGSDCNSVEECAYYDVLATFMGRFFAGNALAARQGLGGFGHLFVIEQVSEVAAERTLVPPDDQPFSCTNLTWQAEFPSGSFADRERRAEANKQFLIEQARAHGDDLMSKEMQSLRPLNFLGLTGRVQWSSRDLLLTYTADFIAPVDPKKGKKKHPAPGGPKRVNLTKQTCQQVGN